MPPQVTLAPQLCIYTFTSLMSTHRHPEHKLQIHEKSECFLMTAVPPSSGVLQKWLPPCHMAKKKRLEVPTILPEPPRPKDAKSVEKPGRRAILAALEFFHISWFLNPIIFYYRLTGSTFELPVHQRGTTVVPSGPISSCVICTSGIASNGCSLPNITPATCTLLHREPTARARRSRSH